MIKVMLVDDHTLIRKGIILLLETFGDIEWIGEAESGEEAILKSLQLELDVILMDLSMPIKMILLTMYDEEVYIYQAVLIMAHGYLLKNSRAGDLHEAIRAVYAGQTYYRTSIPAVQIAKWALCNREEKKKTTVLTDREKEIVRLISLGFGNLEISNKLHLSNKTVENHKSRIMQKLELKSNPSSFSMPSKIGIWICRHSWNRVPANK